MANKFNKKAPSSAKQVTKAKPKRKTSTRSAGAKTTSKKKNTVKRNALHRLGGEYATKPTQKKTTKKAPSKKKTTKAKPKAKAKVTSKAGQSKRVEKPPGGGIPKKESFPHFRYYKKSKHPALIIDEIPAEKKEDEEYRYRKVTHSERDGRHINEKVDPNPNKSDNRPMYIVKRKRHDKKSHFSSWKYDWEF